jgi:hypothetical protein
MYAFQWFETTRGVVKKAKKAARSEESRQVGREKKDACDQDEDRLHKELRPTKIFAVTNDHQRLAKLLWRRAPIDPLGRGVRLSPQ